MSSIRAIRTPATPHLLAIVSSGSRQEPYYRHDFTSDLSFELTPSGPWLRRGSGAWESPDITITGIHPDTRHVQCVSLFGDNIVLYEGDRRGAGPGLWQGDPFGEMPLLRNPIITMRRWRDFFTEGGCSNITVSGPKAHLI